MKKFLIIGLLFLTACATVQNPVNNNQLATVESSYGIALSLAVAYRKLPLCKKSISNLVCAKRSIIVQLQNADRKVQIALVNARSFIKNNPTLDAFSVIVVAQNALATLQQIENSNGIY